MLKEVTRATIEYDQEDLQAQKAPSLMQQMMEVNGNDSDDDEEEDENTTAEPTIENKKDQWFNDS